jgi:hypothetical protein
MKNHTKEPWAFAEHSDGIEETPAVIASPIGTIAEMRRDLRGIDECRANARRIVACVNACAGIPNAALSQGIVPVHLFSAVCEQRDANRERIKELVACVTELINCAHPDRDYAELKRARSLLRSLGRM